jgi:hypothetical protein
MNPCILKQILSLCDADSLDSVDIAIPEWHKIVKDIRTKFLEQQIAWKYTIPICPTQNVFYFMKKNFILDISLKNNKNPIIYYGNIPNKNKERYMWGQIIS